MHCAGARRRSWPCPSHGHVRPSGPAARHPPWPVPTSLRLLAPPVGIDDRYAPGLRALNVRRDAPVPRWFLAIASFGRLFTFGRFRFTVRFGDGCAAPNEHKMIDSLGSARLGFQIQGWMEPISPWDPWPLYSGVRRAMATRVRARRAALCTCLLLLLLLGLTIHR